LCILKTSGFEEPRLVYDPRSISVCPYVSESPMFTLALIKKVFFAIIYAVKKLGNKFTV